MSRRCGLRQRQAGFTLTEMMTVVVIIGILAAIAIPSLRNPADSETTTRNLASLIGEAARLAVNRGPVAAAVVANEADDSRARIRIGISQPNVAIVELRVEVTATTSSWDQVQTLTLPRGVQMAGFSTVADLAGGAAVTAADVLINCAPTGQCDARTVYLQRTDAATDKFRIVVMPLSTAPQVLPGW